MSAGKEIEIVRVGFESGVTISMGNYESIRVAVSMEAACVDGDRDGTFEVLSGLVREKLWEAVGVEKKMFREERGK